MGGGLSDRDQFQRSFVRFAVNFIAKHRLEASKSGSQEA